MFESVWFPASFGAFRMASLASQALVAGVSDVPAEIQTGMELFDSEVGEMLAKLQAAAAPSGNVFTMSAAASSSSSSSMLPGSAAAAVAAVPAVVPAAAKTTLAAAAKAALTVAPAVPAAASSMAARETPAEPPAVWMDYEAELRQKATGLCMIYLSSYECYDTRVCFVECRC